MAGNGQAAFSVASRAAGLLPGLQGADFQIGCVVEDLEAASRLWGAMLGIGPWIAMDDYTGYKIHWNGSDLDIGMAVAFSYFGDVQVELIAPKPGVISPHREFLDKGGNGFHHLGFLAEDFPAAMDGAKAAGLTAAFEVSSPGAANRTVYFNAPPGIGCYIEIVDLPQQRRKGFNAIKALVSTWDGTRPFRKYNRIQEFMDEQNG